MRNLILLFVLFFSNLSTASTIQFSLIGTSSGFLQPCNLPWGGTISSGSSITAFITPKPLVYHLAHS
jgi:hypothetical protein